MATVLSAKQGLLKIADVAATRAYIAQLSAAQPAQRQALLLTQMQLLAETGTPGATRLKVLELLRPTTLETQHVRSRDYWDQPVPFDDDTREIFHRSIAVWQTLADAYESLIADIANSDEVAAHAALICYRAIRYTGFVMTAYNRAYHSFQGTLWEQMHRLYAFAESAGVTDTPVSEGDVSKSTINLTYLQTLLTQRANPESLTLLQMNTMGRALAQWLGLCRISATAGAASPDLALGVDLGSAEGARRVKHLKGVNLRYLDLEGLGDKLRETAVALKTHSPDKLGLGSIPREACETLMMNLYAHWLAPGTGRKDERKPVSFNVKVSPTLASIHFAVSGKPFAPPDAGLNSRARFELGGFERVDGPTAEDQSAARDQEVWTVANQSVSGVLGMCRKPSQATRITHNQLLGLIAPNGNSYLGFVQRLNVDTQGMTWVGLRLIRSKAQAVAARVADPQVRYDRALLLAGSNGSEPPTIVVQPDTYSPGRLLDLNDGSQRQIRLTALLDSGSNFERATYSAA